MDSSNLHKFLKGDVLVYEGDEGDTLYVIDSGRVAVKIGDNQVATLGPGEFFGELGLLLKKPRGATVEALEDVEAMIVDEETFEDMLTFNPSVTFKIMVALAQRLEKSNFALELMGISNPLGRACFYLLNTLDSKSKSRGYGDVKLTLKELARVCNLDQVQILKVAQELEDKRIITQYENYIRIRNIVTLEELYFQCSSNA